MSGPIPEQGKQTEVNKPLKRQEESRSLGWTRGQGVPLLLKTQPGLGGSLAGGLLAMFPVPVSPHPFGGRGGGGVEEMGVVGSVGPRVSAQESLLLGEAGGPCGLRPRQRTHPGARAREHEK